MLLHAAAGRDVMVQQQARVRCGLGSAGQGWWYELAKSET
jgi:hypothetical protein